METTTLTIQVPRNISARLEEAAKNKGENVAEYVGGLIEKDLDRRRALEEILAPLRKDFAESGMTEDDLDTLITSERRALRDEKNVR